MLSICIPTYNFPINQLVADLSDQAAKLTIDYEIIVIDDASDSEFCQLNSTIVSFPHARYIVLKNNIGRSKIRNLFIEQSLFENLLFIDCDAKVGKSDFLKLYIENLDKAPVIIGGVAYEKQKPESNKQFRWQYGHLRESTLAIERNKEPYNSFKTFNFLINKNILHIVRFDERMTGYGHEDTLFGLELKRNNIHILHIENPLLHLGIETNQVFINKTEKSIENLLHINYLYCNDSEFIQSVKLLRFYNNLNKAYKSIISIIFKIFRPLIRSVLFFKPSMILFDFYKIGYLCSIKRLKNQ